MFKRLQAKGYNDIDDVDKDYYAHYDFEFAKSGSNHANFQQKYLKNQASHIGKPLVASNATAPPPEDGLAGAYGTKADTKPTSDTDGLVRGLGIGLWRFVFGNKEINYSEHYFIPNFSKRL